MSISKGDYDYTWRHITPGVDPSNFKRLKYVGKVPIVKNMYGYVGKKNHSFGEFVSGTQFESEILKYGLNTSTTQRVETGLGQYEVEFKPNPFTHKEMTFARKFMDFVYGSHVTGYRILEFEDITIPWRTSCGFPGNVFADDKTDYFGMFGDTHYLYWDLIGKCREHRKADRPKTMWSHTVKVEIVKVKKLATNLGRVFLNPSIDSNIAMMRLGQDYNARFAMSHPVGPSRVGMSPLKGGFDRLARDLLHNTIKEETDYVKWDKHLMAWLIREEMEFRWKHLHESYRTKENRSRFEVIFEDTINSLIISPDGRIYEKDDGTLPSGHPWTTYINTYCNTFLLACIWARTTQIYDIDEYYEKVKQAIYGDDNNRSTDLSVWPMYNVHSIAEVAASAGMRCPVIDDNGDVNSKWTFDLEETKFIGATFDYDAEYEMYFPKFEGAKALAGLYYPEKPLNVEESLGIAHALRLLLWRNKPYFQLMSNYCTLMARKGYRPSAVKIKKKSEIEYLGVLDERDIVRIYTGFESSEYDYSSIINLNIPWLRNK